MALKPASGRVDGSIDDRTILHQNERQPPTHMSTTVVLENLQGMNAGESMQPQGLVNTTKRDLTLSAHNAASNNESRDTVNFTTPPNSRSIRATSVATRRRSLLVSLIKDLTPRSTMGQAKWSWMADKSGEVAGLRVESAMGIQGRPLPFQPTARAKSTS